VRLKNPSYFAGLVVVGVQALLLLGFEVEEAVKVTLVFCLLTFMEIASTNIDLWLFFITYCRHS
jgi:hypothetical protein